MQECRGYEKKCKLNDQTLSLQSLFKKTHIFKLLIKLEAN